MITSTRWSRSLAIYVSPVLGDSIVEALQVPIEQRFTTVLQKDLEKNTGKHIEVMNFGTGGFSTGQEYLQYIQNVRQYKPDLVLLVMHHGDEDGKWSCHI